MNGIEFKSNTVSLTVGWGFAVRLTALHVIKI